MPPRQIPIGVIISAHGVRGLVKVKTEASNFKAMLEEQAITFDGKSVSARVVGAHTSPFIVQIEGVEDRNVAEALRGKTLYVSTNAASAPDATEFVVDEVVGVVVEEHGEAIATITHMYNFGAGEIVELTYTNGKSELFPFNASTFPEIDIAAKRASFNRPVEL
jgi:16S rRNA processing protein RimM